MEICQTGVHTVLQLFMFFIPLRNFSSYASPQCKMGTSDPIFAWLSDILPLDLLLYQIAPL